jgi:hypothetical protein
MFLVLLRATRSRIVNTPERRCPDVATIRGITAARTRGGAVKTITMRLAS